MNVFRSKIIFAVVAVAMLMAVTVSQVLASMPDTTSAPNNLRASVKGTEVVINWTPGTDEAYDYQAIRYRKSAETSKDWTRTLTQTTTRVAHYVPGQLSAGEEYIFQIAGVESGEGVGLSERGLSNETTVTVPDVVIGQDSSDPATAAWSTATTASTSTPGLPNLRATIIDDPDGDGQLIKLTWTPSTRRALTEQRLMRRVAEKFTDPDLKSISGRLSTSSREYTDRAISPGTPYIYRVLAWGRGKILWVSNRVHVVGPGAYDSRHPHGLVGVPTRSGVHLGWNPSTHESYSWNKLMRRTLVEPQFTVLIGTHEEFWGEESSKGRITKYFDSTLQPGTEYIYLVESVRTVKYPEDLLRPGGVPTKKSNRVVVRLVTE